MHKLYLLTQIFVLSLMGDSIDLRQAEERHIRYVIIGAGPGGLQLAHYLDSAGRDYTILEQNSKPGSFFETLPRFRKLISINKRHSGRVELDHMMRHDWNSLLSDPSHSAYRTDLPTSSTDAALSLTLAERYGWLFFRNYSHDYYPHADDLVRYIHDWSAGSRLNLTGGHPATPLRIQYNTFVFRISALQPQTEASVGVLRPRFRLFISDGSSYTCTFLVMATGLQVGTTFLPTHTRFHIPQA